jgi:hypothetical protein
LNLIFFSIFSSFTFTSVKSPASGKENVQFRDSPEFEKFAGLPDVMSGRALRQKFQVVISQDFFLSKPQLNDTVT